MERKFYVSFDAYDKVPPIFCCKKFFKKIFKKMQKRY